MATRLEGEYHPIADYALIGDAHTAALVSRGGSIDWCCWPHLDSPAIFCRLLDARRGGWFQIAPTNSYTVTRQYVDGTNVLATTFRTDSGEMRLTDFMPAEPRSSDRRGEDIEESHCILRLIEGLRGEMDVAVHFRPTFDYARANTTIDLHERVAIARGGNTTLRLRTSITLSAGPDGGITGIVHVRPGDRRWIVLADEDDPEIADPEATLDTTLKYWRQWIHHCTYQGPYEVQVRRSALLLKLLTFEPTGALVAAPTTSLPEEVGGIRNWDYRYTWLRDASLALYSLMSIGYHDEALDFWTWLESLCLSCQQPMQVVYTLGGDPDLPECTLDHLEGYRGSRPVRIGNAAGNQIQLDIYGDVLDAAHFCYEGMRSRRQDLWPVLALMADRAADRWREPDQGLWEIRSGPRHFLYSKLLCWVALDRAVRLSDAAGMPGDAARWRRVGDEIRTAILNHGYDQTLGAFTQAFDYPVLDASALVIPLVGFLPPTDPRVRSTARRVQERLMSNGLVYRYLADDGLAGSEATFALCSFWLVDNLALSGQIDEARQLFERVVGYGNDVGLLSEEIDPVTGELRGNFPQGFSHLALIRSALNIARAEAVGPEERATVPADRQPENEHVKTRIAGSVRGVNTPASWERTPARGRNPLHEAGSPQKGVRNG